MNAGMHAFPAVFGLLFGLVWLVFAIGGVVGWILLLVAVWKTMRAHESLAHLKDRQTPPPQ